MSRLLFGSSNVYRNFSSSTIGQDLGLSLVQCTKKAVLDAHVATLGTVATGSLVVTSVLENFVTDACRDLADGEIDLFGNQQITAHVETLATLIRGSPDSVALVSPLLPRSVPGGLFAKVESINTRLVISLDFFQYALRYILSDFF